MAAGAKTGERYRKMPGHRRGFWNGSSVWMGSDHLLLVKSFRFREEYKRYYLRDVQAIAVARGSRFHISSRAFAIGVAWVVAYATVSGASFDLGSWISLAMWGAALALLVSWLYISEACSCRCRIYTAVSADDLPSVYRTWTARRFLEEAWARISEVQGVLEGDWAEAAETVEVGPPIAAVRGPVRQVQQAGAEGREGPVEQPLPRPPAPVRTWASDTLLGSLLAGAALALVSRSSMGAAVRWTLGVLLLGQIGAAVAMLIQHSQGKLGAAMKNLGIATLVLLGLGYYAWTFLTAANATGSVLPRQVVAGAELLLALVGISIVVRGGRPGHPDMMKGLTS